MESFDLRILFRKILQKWYWFAISLFISFSIAVCYLFLANKEYLIETVIQLKDHGISDKGSPKEKFLVGYELLEHNPELEDEIGLLTSYSLINQSLEKLNLEISYYQYPENLSFAKNLLYKEVYPSPFKVHLDSKDWQILSTPIYMKFIDKKRVHIKIQSENSPVKLYQFASRETKYIDKKIDIDTIINLSAPFRSSFLSISFIDVEPDVWESNNSYFIKVSSLKDISANYLDKLKNARISEKSNIMKLSLKGVNPKKEIDVLTSIAKTYIENDLKKKTRLGEKTIEFLDFQLAGVTDSLRSTENVLKSFRSEYQIIDINTTSQNLNQKLFVLEDKQAQLSVQNQYYNYIKKYLMQTEQSDVVAPSSVGIADDHLHSLLNTLSALNSEKIAKGHSSNEQAPIIQVLDKKIESTKKSIKDNVDNLIGANKIAMRENLRRINEFKSELSRLPENEMNLKDIQRRFTFNDNIYNYLLQKRTDAAIAMASTVSDKSIVDYPRQIGKAPVAPNNILVILFAIIGGIAVPAAYILGSQLFITKVDSALQLSRWTNIPIVKSLAPVKLNKSEYALNRSGYLAHAFRYIYMQLDKTIPGLKAKVIGVSSAVNGEGKTFCAVNLAYSFVTAGKKTLLIDTDLNKPQLANIFGLNNQKGLADYLTDEDLSHITNTKYEGLDILVAGSKVENASELLLKADFKKLIESLKYKYEAIILDTAPVGLVADYLIISAHTDYTFLIVRQDVSEKDDIENLEEIITQHDLKAGIIYNCDNSINTNKEYYK